MNTISGRVNGQASYQPLPEARAAWREEMLDQLLTQMRQRRLPEAEAPIQREAAVPGKGSFVDLYV